MNRIELIRGDITKVEADAIVNAANSSLLGGGGVDGAIHRAAGPDLLEACRKLNGCAAGDAKITEGFNLRARYVIHTVGPVWRGGNFNEASLLGKCYMNSLQLAAMNSIKKIAFPNISTGIYGFPKNQAAEIALNSVKKWLESHPEPEKVIFVVFDEDNAEIYNRLLA
jgi:O-acetyl-ADP-ribose deacetylase